MSITMDATMLKTLNRRALQDVAKSVGVTANSKTEVIVAELVKKFPDGVPALPVEAEQKASSGGKKGDKEEEAKAKESQTKTKGARVGLKIRSKKGKAAKKDTSDEAATGLALVPVRPTNTNVKPMAQAVVAPAGPVPASTILPPVPVDFAPGVNTDANDFTAAEPIRKSTRPPRPSAKKRAQMRVPADAPVDATAVGDRERVIVDYALFDERWQLLQEAALTLTAPPKVARSARARQRRAAVLTPSNSPKAKKLKTGAKRGREADDDEGARPRKVSRTTTREEEGALLVGLGIARVFEAEGTGRDVGEGAATEAAKENRTTVAKGGKGKTRGGKGKGRARGVVGLEAGIAASGSGTSKDRS